MEASVDPLFGGPDWTPITPKRGSFLHADSQPTTYAFRVRGADSSNGTLPDPDIALKTAGGASVPGGTLLHDITATNQERS